MFSMWHSLLHKLT